MRLNSGATSAAKNHGPGGLWGWPYKRKWLKYVNNTTEDHFIPENSTAEKRASYARAPVTKVKGDYEHGGYVYDNTAGFDKGPCWVPYVPSYATAHTPPGCPANFTDNGVVFSRAQLNSNNYSGNTANPHGNPHHVGWYYFGWGCDGGAYHSINVRYCRI